MNSKSQIITLILISWLISISSNAQLSCKVNEVDSFESKTNYSELEYDTSNVIIKICKHYPNHRSDFSIIYGEPAPKVHAYIYRK
jgi:hypothetical protein